MPSNHWHVFGLISDVCIGAFFDEQKAKDREIERLRRLGLVQQWLEGDDSIEGELQSLVDQQRHKPFHWALEFAEVFKSHTSRSR